MQRNRVILNNWRRTMFMDCEEEPQFIKKYRRFENIDYRNKLSKSTNKIIISFLK